MQQRTTSLWDGEPRFNDKTLRNHIISGLVPGCFGVTPIRHLGRGQSNRWKAADTDVANPERIVGNPDVNVRYGSLPIGA
jgi:hypothetical protein